MVKHACSLLLLQVNDGLLLDEKLSDYQAAFAAVDRDRCVLRSSTRHQHIVCASPAVRLLLRLYCTSTPCTAAVHWIGAFLPPQRNVKSVQRGTLLCKQALCGTSEQSTTLMWQAYISKCEASAAA
jgi:hypothetical protein